MRTLSGLDLNLETRDRELVEIARSISELAELFKDLSALVIDQGTLLDSVEYNIEQTAAHMEDAVRELDVATKYVCFLRPLVFSPFTSHVGRDASGCRIRPLFYPFHSRFFRFPPSTSDLLSSPSPPLTLLAYYARASASRSSSSPSRMASGIDS